MKINFALGLVLLGAAPLAPALLTWAHARPANVPIHTPKPGSKERTAIMDATRIPVARYHKGKRVTFNRVDPLRVGGGWAFFSAETIDSQNRPLEDLDFSALLHLVKGQWRVVEWAYHGDVVQIEWAQDHPSVPLNVLGLKASDLR